MDLGVYDAFIKGVIQLSVNGVPGVFVPWVNARYKIGSWKCLSFEKWKKGSDEEGEKVRPRHCRQVSFRNTYIYGSWVSGN